MKGLLFDIRRYSVHDGPGIRTTLFFKGCPLNCLWCHNPEGILPDPQPILRNRKSNGEECKVMETVGRWYTTTEVLREIEADQLFYDESGGGVTFSGGEPLMQPVFLIDVISQCKKSGYHCAVDTSGHAPANIFNVVADQADMLLFDIKAINSKLHREYTGEDNELILENFLSLQKNGPKVLVRIPVIPGLNDNPEEMKAILHLLKSSRANILAVHLLPYHQLGRQKYEALQLQVPPVFQPQTSASKMKQFLSIFTKAGFATKTGG